MSNNFEETMELYLSGRLTREEAEARIATIPLEPDQAGRWRLALSLDRALAQRAAAGGSDPWLTTKVMANISARERARQWISSHPGGVFGRRGFSLPSLGAPRQWAIAGAALLAAAGVVSSLLYYMPGWADFSSISVGGFKGSYMLIGAAALAAALVVTLPGLKRYYV